jgi:RNA recognition motif-containing protein
MSALDMSLDQLMKRGSSRPAKGGGPGKVTASSRAIRRPAPYAAAKSAGKGSGRAQPQGGKSVYVGNLAWDVSWQDLKDHFKTVGQVLNADVMMEPGTTRSKGCGLVTFANARDAATAISTLHDTELNGRLIFVREDRDAGTDVGTVAVGGKGGGGGAAGAGASVYVGNLAWDVSWQDLKDHFKTVGQVLHADVMMEPGTTRSKGCGLVTFANARDAATAISTLHDTELNGRLIFVREDREGGAGVGMAGRGGSAVAPTDGCKVFVGGLPRETTWMDLKDMFREAGSVVRADVAQAPDGTSKGYGTVLLGSTREAAKAIQLFNETEYQGRTIQVRPDAHP